MGLLSFLFYSKAYARVESGLVTVDFMFKGVRHTGVAIPRTRLKLVEGEMVRVWFDHKEPDKILFIEEV